MDTQRALQWLTDIFSVKNRVVSIDDTRDSLAEWDSLGSLLLLSALEEEHQIVISADELEAMKAVREICDLLEKHNAFRAA
jgi:acyl carrier protein